MSVCPHLASPFNSSSFLLSQFLFLFPFTPPFSRPPCFSTVHILLPPFLSFPLPFLPHIFFYYRPRCYSTLHISLLCILFSFLLPLLFGFFLPLLLTSNFSVALALSFTLPFLRSQFNKEERLSWPTRGTISLPHTTKGENICTPMLKGSEPLLEKILVISKRVSGPSNQF